MKLTSLEICAGGGGQALGLEMAGFHHVGLVEMDEHSCDTLRVNRPQWNVIQTDVRSFDAGGFNGIDLFAGGVPCPPFSIAGKQLGADDERDLFPTALRLISETRPKAILLENVRGLLDPRFSEHRDRVTDTVEQMGYDAEWQLLNACDYGVPQLRPRVLFVAILKSLAHNFSWPGKINSPVATVGTVLYDLMAVEGWPDAESWRDKANNIAPTIVGGSRKHGGPDLGPTRARKAWALMGVDGIGIANAPPPPNFSGLPRLTLRMGARLQGFPDSWHFCGGKTAAYRQVGNAFPPPVAHAVARQIAECLITSAKDEAVRTGRLAKPKQERLFAHK
jgi:DNA (cytosine-5)-methyltransferase 1